MKQMVHTLTQRILHQPTERLREAAAESDQQFLKVAQELFLGRSDDGDDDTDTGAAAADDASRDAAESANGGRVGARR